MGSTLLINGQPLQVGQTGTIVLNAFTYFNSSSSGDYVGTISTPIVVPLSMVDYNIYYSGEAGYQNVTRLPDPMTSNFLTNIVGTLTISSTVGSYGLSMYFIYSYVSPTTIYQVPTYFSTSSILIASAYTLSLTTVITVSLSNVVGFYARLDKSLTTYTVTIGMRGAIVYTIVGTL